MMLREKGGKLRNKACHPKIDHVGEASLVAIYLLELIGQLASLPTLLVEEWLEDSFDEVSCMEEEEIKNRRVRLMHLI